MQPLHAKSTSLKHRVRVSWSFESQQHWYWKQSRKKIKNSNEELSFRISILFKLWMCMKLKALNELYIFIVLFYYRRRCALKCCDCWGERRILNLRRSFAISKLFRRRQTMNMRHLIEANLRIEFVKKSIILSEQSVRKNMRLNDSIEIAIFDESFQSHWS